MTSDSNEERLLKDIANITIGKYFPAPDASYLEEIYKKISEIVENYSAGELFDTDTMQVTVQNVAPTPAPFGPFTADEGSSMAFTFSTEDPGSDDLTFTWNWGDGTSDNVTKYYNNGLSPEPDYDPVPNEIKSPWGAHPFSVTDTMSHTYGDNGFYTITLTATDDDNGISTYTTTITVNNAAPSVNSITAPSGIEGSPITFSSIATDPGSDDLTFTWDWGDGTTATTTTYYNNGVSPDPPQSPWGTYPYTVTDTVQHTYGDNGVYTITLTVTDDDGKTTIITADVVVNNVAPTITLAITPSGDEGSSLTFEAGATD
ncbi:MAG: PKD domain-containing protein, partial [Thermoplasmata archaeon]